MGKEAKETKERYGLQEMLKIQAKTPTHLHLLSARLRQPRGHIIGGTQRDGVTGSIYPNLTRNFPG